MADVRIGVFICHCGRNIGGYVNVPQVVEFASGLPNVVHAEDNLYTCSEEGISAIKRGIREQDLNRVVVASCTPRTHEPLFRSACEEAGLNKYLFEFANIRDQCSWIHMELPEEATEKAKDIVRAAIAKATLLEPLDEIEIQVTPACLVIGGGVTGLSAALNLANQDFEVHLVEKEYELGGMMRNLHRLFPTQKDADELAGSLVEQVTNNDNIKVYLKASVREVSGFIGNFDVTIDSESKEIEIKVGTIIVATGADEFKPESQYGYGKTKGVLTQLELEKELKAGTNNGHNVVMINCVGARVDNRTYCGRFCCLTAIKNAMQIRENNPKSKVWILHRDVMAYGVDFEDYYRKAMETGVRFIRYDLDRLPEVIGNGKVEGVKVYHQLLQKEIELPANTVVLTTPLVANEDNEELSKILKVPLSQENFFLEAHLKLQPVEFATDGIYIAGSARWPVESTEAIFQGCAAASKAAIPMRRGYVKPEAITAYVDPDMCSGCGTCSALCPYNAISINNVDGKRVSEVITALCKGCGTCGAACPSGAISMNQFRTDQLLSQIEAYMA